MKPGLTITALTALLTLTLGVSPRISAQEPQQPSAVPDAPSPQAQPPALRSVNGPIKPGGGAGTESAGTSGSGDGQPNAPTTTPPPINTPQTAAPKPADQTPPPDFDNPEQLATTLRLYTTYVNVPVTVKDSKGKLVPGLTWRDFKVYENGTPEPLKIFSVDATALSMAFVIDQSVTKDVMAKVNDSLGAIQGALTPYDEIAVFSYSNGAQNRSGGFTGAQSARVPYVLSMTKASGTEETVPVNDGPFASCNIRQNGNCVDPNLQAGRSAGNGTFITLPKEIHTLNDAILAAAKELSTRPKGRRRIIYVISDGKEYGSKATYKDVLRYLETNEIQVYGTLVGDSARFGEGYLSRFHLPFTMYDNRLVSYVLQTGGSLDSEKNLNGIEKSYQAIAGEARNQYTLVYATHEPLIDGKFRSIDVRVNRPGLDVVAKKGYYPSAEDQK
ncbi:MAG TPA: VWA domain-containing protein [Terracidiphilus sp.]